MYCPVLQEVIPSDLQFVALEARKALVCFKYLPLPAGLVLPVLSTLEQVSCMSAVDALRPHLQLKIAVRTASQPGLLAINESATCTPLTSLSCLQASTAELWPERASALLFAQYCWFRWVGGVHCLTV
jgi:hypothetical protein